MNDAEIAKREGETAFVSGAPLSQNPFKTDGLRHDSISERMHASALYFSWRAGWLEAQAEDLSQRCVIVLDKVPEQPRQGLGR